MRRDRPQPDGLPRVTPELIDGLDRERLSRAEQN